MSARRPVHHSHQHAAAPSAHNAQSTGVPLRRASPRAGLAAFLHAPAVGNDPQSRNRVYDPLSSGESQIRILPSSIDHLLHRVCPFARRVGSSIRHAADPELSVLTPLLLGLVVGVLPLLRPAVLPPGGPPRPAVPLGPTGIVATVGVSPVAAPVDAEVLAAGAARDDQEIQSPSAGRETGPLGPAESMMALLGDAHTTVGGPGCEGQPLPYARAASEPLASPISPASYRRIPRTMSVDARRGLDSERCPVASRGT